MPVLEPEKVVTVLQTVKYSIRVLRMTINGQHAFLRPEILLSPADGSGWTDARDLVEDEAWEALKAVLTQGRGFALTVTFSKSLWYY